MLGGIALLAAILLAGGLYLTHRQGPASAARIAGPPLAASGSSLPAAGAVPAALAQETRSPVPPETTSPAQIGQAKVTQAAPSETPAIPTRETPGHWPLVPVVGGADKLAFLNENDIWIANLDGSDLTRLTMDGASKLNLQWSPDGRAVHFISGKCVQSVDIQTLHLDPLVCFEAAHSLEAFEISPNGQEVAISLDHGLYIVPFARELLAGARHGGDLQSMAGCISLAPYRPEESVLTVKQVRWSRDGKQLAINRPAVAGGEKVDLIQMLDISNCLAGIRRLDEFPATRFKMEGYDLRPTIQSFAWDGEALFALNSFKRNDGYGDLWIYSTELHRAYQFAPVAGACCYRDPVWSPDGSYLLFAFQDRSKAPGNLVRLYYVPVASLGTGLIYVPLSLPDELFPDPHAKPMPALRPAP